MKDFDQLIVDVEKSGRRLEFYGGATVESIAAVEHALAITLPKSYRDFLSQFGGGGVAAGMPIAGICDDQPLLGSAGSVYGETIDARNEFNIPAACIVVFRDDDTYVLWCLDTDQRSSDGECPVVSINWETGVVDRVVAPSFRSFFEEYLRLRR